MIRWLKRREDKVWTEGFDRGWELAQTTTLFLARKRFMRLEKDAEVTPNLYSLDDILKVLGDE